MAISHEISSEIAAALFARRPSQNRSPHELHELKEMLEEIHSTLERLQQHAKQETLLDQIGGDTLTRAAGQHN